MTREDERPPADHWKKRFPELEKELLDSYYAFKGWNERGIPTKEALEGLGLGFVAEDLAQRGILTADGSAGPAAGTPGAGKP